MLLLDKLTAHGLVIDDSVVDIDTCLQIANVELLAVVGIHYYRAVDVVYSNIGNSVEVEILVVVIYTIEIVDGVVYTCSR